MIRVFVSGCFDRLHPGHIEFLKYAASLGDHLTVSVGNDESIRQLKKREPIFNQYERLGMVQALFCVDHAFIPVYVGAGDCLEAVRAIMPDVWVMNREDSNLAEKLALAEELCIGVVYNPRPLGYHSTTKLAQALEEGPGTRTPPQPRANMDPNSIPVTTRGKSQ